MNMQQHKEMVDKRIRIKNMKLDTQINKKIAVDELQSTAIDAHVHKQKHLSSNIKQKFTQHLNDIIVNNNTYSFVENIDSVNNFKKNSLEYNLYSDNRAEKAQQLINNLILTEDKTEYQSLLTELNTLYVPEFISKDQHIIDKDAKQAGNEILKGLEEVDYPISAPQKENINDNNYMNEKKTAIKEMVDSVNHLTDEQRKKLLSVLYKNIDRFSLRGENMERTDTVLHEIDTAEARPFKERLRNYSSSIQTTIDKEVKKMLDEGIIQPSHSPYASNLLLVRKPDPSSEGGVKNRVCASFVQLNKQTVKDSYPLPLIQSIFDRIGASKWFTTMDLLNGFWQVMIKPEHRYKTAFITSRGLFEFVVMAFGLCNAPATFQRLMDTVIKPEYRSFIETYIDDVVTHSKSFDDHIIHLNKLLCSLRDHKLVVKLSKCKFAQLEVKFLGHIISHDSIKPNPESVESITKWLRPAPGSNRVKAIRGFLGMVGWYRRFIPHFATIAKPLFNLTKKDAKWDWTTACEEAFVTLRDALITKPVLRIADPNKRYVLHTDASDYALGAILMQEDESGFLHPLAYASVTLNAAEQKYTVTEREAMAIPWAVEHFNTYLEGHKYTAITDHSALKYLWNNKDKTPRLLRALLRLQPYEIELYYKPGSQNYAADLLSREKEMMQLNSYYLRKRNNKNIIDNSSSDDVSNHSTTDNNDKNAANKNFIVKSQNSKQKTKKRLSGRRNINISYDVEEVLDKRLITESTNEYEYLIKWLGYDSSQNTWEPLHNLNNAMNKVAEYEAKRQLRDIEGEVELGRMSRDDVDISSETITQEQHVKQHVCIECGHEATSSSNLYVHKYKEHAIPIPVPSQQVGIVEENTQLLKQMQLKEKEFKIIFDYMNDKAQSDSYTLSERKFMNNYEFVTNEEGVLFCIDLPGSRTRSRVRTRMRICIPKPIRIKLLQQVHEGILSSHPGVIHMYDKLREYVWWPSLISDVTLYVRQCVKCQQRRQRIKKAPVLPMTVPGGPWLHIGVDITGPFPITSRNNIYILVVIDHFTRWAEAFAISDQKTETIASIIVSGIICRHGLPRVIQSDRGSNFVSHLAQQIYAMLGIKRVTTTAWHPQSNGVVERFNGTLKETLSMWVNEEHTDWDVLLPFALFAYNTSVHQVLHESPFYLLHGRDARLPIDYIVTTTQDNNNISTHEYAISLVDRLRDVHTRVTDILNNINSDRENKINDSSLIKYEVGDSVWLYKHNTQVGRSRKLTRRWTGPYEIVEVKSLVNYALNADGKIVVVHVNRLKKAHAEEKPSLETYTNDIELLQQQLDSIDEVHHDIVVRKLEVQQQMSQLKALSQVRKENKVSSSDIVESGVVNSDTNSDLDVEVDEIGNSVAAVDMIHLYHL